MTAAIISKNKQQKYQLLIKISRLVSIIQFPGKHKDIHAEWLCNTERMVRTINCKTKQITPSNRNILCLKTTYIMDSESWSIFANMRQSALEYNQRSVAQILFPWLADVFSKGMYSSKVSSHQVSFWLQWIITVCNTKRN
jgi:hypothetical protein